MTPAPSDSLAAQTPSAGARGELSDASWRYLGWGLVLLSILPFLYTIASSHIDGDIPVYYRAARALFDGPPLYRETPFEYPPYLLPWLVLPGLAPGPLGFRYGFLAEMLALDVFLKWLLLREGRRALSGARAFAPFAIVALGGWIQEYLYLRRFDLIPATLTVLAALFLARRRSLSSGLLVALAAGTKLYPVVFLPVMGAIALQQGRLRRFVAGVVAGTLPLALLSGFMPWWRFADFHRGRGLQAESLYASILWLFRDLTSAEWAVSATGVDVAGPASARLLPFARVAFVVAVGTVTLLATWAARRNRDFSVGSICTWMLLPLLAFVSFNTVLSPQYHIWFLGLAALAVTSGELPLAIALLAATSLIPIFFPSPSYDAGLDLGRTLVLVLRNLALVAVLGWLSWRQLTSKSSSKPSSSEGG